MTGTRARACGTKRGHTTRASAERHMLRLIAGGASPAVVNIYPCRHCGLLHVGHIVRNGRRRHR